MATLIMQQVSSPFNTDLIIRLGNTRTQLFSFYVHPCKLHGSVCIKRLWERRFSYWSAETNNIIIPCCASHQVNEANVLYTAIRIWSVHLCNTPASLSSHAVLHASLCIVKNTSVSLISTTSVCNFRMQLYSYVKVSAISWPAALTGLHLWENAER